MLHPDVRPPSSEFVALNVPPPVAVIPYNEPHAIVDVPLAMLSVATTLLFPLLMLIGRDEVPVHVIAFDTVVVTAGGSPRVVPAASEILEKVFAPDIITGPLELFVDTVRGP